MSENKKRTTLYNTKEYKVEYSRPGSEETRVDFFTTLDAAAAFIECFKDDSEAVITKVDEEGVETFIKSNEYMTRGSARWQRKA